MLFLSTSTHALHLFKLLSRTLFLFWLRYFLRNVLRSNLIWLLNCLFYFFLLDCTYLLNLLLLLLLGWLLIILRIILRLISWTYECSVLIRSGLLRCVPLVLVKIPGFLGLNPFFVNSVGNSLAWFQAENIPSTAFLQSELITAIYGLMFRENIVFFT